MPKLKMKLLLRILDNEIMTKLGSGFGIKPGSAPDTKSVVNLSFFIANPYIL